MQDICMDNTYNEVRDHGKNHFINFDRINTLLTRMMLAS